MNTAPLKTFKCKCGADIVPPDVMPPMILGGAGQGEFRIKISYVCAKCNASHQSSYEGKIILDNVQITVL